MSGFNRLLARKTEATRPAQSPRRVRARRKEHLVVDAITGKAERVTLPYHKAGAQWWRGKFAELVERRKPDGTYAPRKPSMTIKARRPVAPSPTMLPRPEGMSRQVQRALYRLACSAAGVDYRGYGRPPAPPKGT